MLFDEFLRATYWGEKKPAAEKVAKFKVIVIGGDISGLAAAVQFKRLGISFQVLERKRAIGGTWLLNTYPEARVDTLSFLFQFRFVKNYPGSEYFASAGETQKYLEYVAELYKVKDHFYFNREVVSYVWHEDESEWELTVKHANGESESMRCNAVVSGSGLFATPNKSDIEGMGDFQGVIFHTEKWDHSIDHINKDVALVDTGSTGTQLTASVAAKAKSLTVYQRTPNWIMNMEGYRAPIDETQLQYMQTYGKGWETKGGIINERNDLVRQALTFYITSKDEGIPGLREKIFPDYAPLVRRLVVDNGFYDVLRCGNVELVIDKIDSFTKTGIRSQDGAERNFDVVVLGTGFKVQQYFWPCKPVGRDGSTMEELWKKDGPRSHLGMSMTGFPNFFILYGPNNQPRSGGFYS
ncbi:4-hydroxyacetophenone monooxygenase [Seiridium cupressi]